MVIHMKLREEVREMKRQAWDKWRKEIERERHREVR